MEASSFPLWAAGWIGVSGVLILLGWIAHLPAWQSLFFAQEPTRAGTAAAFILVASALLLLRRDSPSSWARWAVRLSACGVLLIAVAALVRYLFSSAPDLLRLVPAALHWLGTRGIQPATAVALALVGDSILALERGGRRAMVMFQTCTVLALLITLLSLLGYLHGVGDFYRRVGYESMPFGTSLGLTVATLGLLLLRPHQGFVQAFTSDQLGGRMSRRIWLPSIVAILVLGAFTSWAESRAIMSGETHDTVLAWANFAIFSTAMCVSCLALNRSHAHLLHRDRLYGILSQTNQCIARTTDRQNLFEQICRIAICPGGFRSAWIGMASRDRSRLECVASEGLPGAGSAATRPAVELGESALQTRAVVTGPMTGSPGSLAAFPIALRGEPFGCLMVESAEPDFFGVDEKLLLSEVAGDVGFALDLIERENRRTAIERDLWESQSRLRLATEAANLGYWDWDLVENRIKVSPEWSRQLGYTEKEIAAEQLDWRQRIHPADREMVDQQIREHLGGLSLTFEAEFRMRHRDGSARWIYSRARAIRDREGNAARVVGWHLDVTARKLAEHSVRQSEQRLQTVIENLDEGLIISDFDGNLTHCNRAALDMHGLADEGDRMRTFADFSALFELSTMDGTVIPLDAWPMQRAIRGDVLHTVILRIARLDIDWVRIFSYGGARIQGQGDQTLAFITVVDITERTWAETAVRESEARFRELAEHVDEVFWISDPAKRNALYISPAYEKIWGRDRFEVYDQARGWLAAIHPADRDRVQTASETRQTEGDYDETFRIIRPDGSIRWVRDRAFPVRNSAGRVHRLVGTSQDITARKVAELGQNLQHAVTAVFADARSLEEAAKKVIGLICSTLDWTHGELWNVDSVAGCLRCVDTWTVERAEVKAFAARTRQMTFVSGEGLPGRIWAAGELFWAADLMSDSNLPRRGEAGRAGLNAAFGFPVRCRDAVTGIMVFLAPSIREPSEDLRTLATNLGSQMGQFGQRLRIEEQFLQSQKMEAIGQLAGGVAHDFNNLLTVIKAYPQLILQTANLAPEARDWLEQMSQAADRASGLTRQLLTFSRKQVPQFHPIDLNETVNGMGTMLRRIIGEDIALRLDLTRHPGLIDADTGMVEQTLMNLVVNARDAMPRGGQLLVSTRQVELTSATLPEHPRGREGNFLILAVTDTGSGITPEVMKHIFEPFFTTKERGQGTGLGLATIYGIVEQHRGWVELESKVGHGTTFKIYFPMSRTALPRPSVTPAEPAPSLREGRETILLVEDEPAVRMLSKIILERLGYTVVDAITGVAALEIWRQRGSDIDLLITDMIMPQGVNGRDLAEKLREQKPDLKILFTTGYSPASVAQGMNLIEGVNFIQKPYVPQTLSTAIRNCLERPPLPLQ